MYDPTSLYFVNIKKTYFTGGSATQFPVSGSRYPPPPPSDNGREPEGREVMGIFCILITGL